MEKTIDAYPLCWPEGWPRSPVKDSSRFKTTFGSARDSLMAEIRRMGGRDVILSTNIPLRNDGLPYANHRTPDDRAVAVYFKYKGSPMCFACDRWNRIEDNVWSICKTIEALRGIERWGASDMIERAFKGFTALPSPKTKWYEVLEVSPTATEDEVKKARNRLAMKYHPDTGNSPDPSMMMKVNQAFEEFQREV